MTHDAAERRIEYDALLRGQGRFAGDIEAGGTLHMVFVRSRHAAGEIVGVGAEDARALPGMRAIYSGDDLAKSGIGRLFSAMKCPKPDGSNIGTVLNHTIAERQLHGGIVQGVGRASTEHIISDDGGQMLSRSLMDYPMPRASDVPFIDADHEPAPTPTNPLGAKGAGEAGMFGAIPAVISAVCDALAKHGVERLEMPATPQKIWRALQAGE